MKQTLGVFAVHLIALFAAMVALYPILWVCSVALSSDGPSGVGAVPIPEAPGLENFQAVFAPDQKRPWLFLLQLGNSLLIAASTAFLAVAIATPAAYAMSRFAFVGRRATTTALLSTQMFPGVAAAIPLYLLMSAIGLLDTRMGLILVYATSAVPFAIFQLRGAFDTIPHDLEEAAMVDGATQFGAFVRVALPAARPAIAVASLFAFMTAWNEFILAATFLSQEEKFTVPVVLQRFVGEHNAQWGLFAAGAIIVSTPRNVVVLLSAAPLCAWAYGRRRKGLTSPRPRVRLPPACGALHLGRDSFQYRSLSRPVCNARLFR